jgi:hypothetical protein
MQKMLHKLASTYLSKSTFILVMEVETVVATNKRRVSKAELKLFFHRPNSNEMKKPQAT